jgi:flagellar protein FlaG
MNMETISSTAIRGSPEPATAVREAPAGHRHTEVHPTPASDPIEKTSADAEPEPEPEDLASALDGINGFLSTPGNHVKFAMHEGAQRMMVEVIDDRTSEVIRTVPAKELLDLAAKFGELIGTLLDKKG